MTCSRSRFLLIALVATSCGKEQSPVIDAPTSTTTDASAVMSDAVMIDAPPPTACRMIVVSSSSGCSEDCDVRLTLPDGGRFCTVTCTDDPECTAYNANLTCSLEIGTCMQKCTYDAECQSMGLPRCHPVGEFCDTIPPCQSDQQCIDLGYASCKMPERYCA